MSHSQPPAMPAERDRALDGLRGFAALAVLFAHLVFDMGLLPFGVLGVNGVIIFFALSGYLIGTICWRPRRPGRLTGCSCTGE